MVKLNHLRHPVRSTRTATRLVAARLEMRRIAKQGERRFRGDKRYNLSAVTEGFCSRIDEEQDDTALLERICTAYRKSVERQKSAPSIYDATAWWQEVRQRSLRPVMNALLNRDLAALWAMYRNFFRDPCSTGLIGVPYGMARAYFGKSIKDIHRRYYLSDVLQSVEYWKAQTQGQLALRELAGPQIGNPFGVVIENTLVEAGAPYRHYCARKLHHLLPSHEPSVVEIGGGFGGTAFYLLRDLPKMKYIDFDVPESIALTSYYLIRAYPSLKFLLYGEKECTREAIAQTDVMLLPLHEMAAMPAKVAQVSVSSHSISDLSQEALPEYLIHIEHMTKSYFLYVGVDREDGLMSPPIRERHKHFNLVEEQPSGWHNRRNSRAAEVERLYSLDVVEPEREKCLSA